MCVYILERDDWKMTPGEIILSDKDIICNSGRKTRDIVVVNNGDRPIQVGSHFHFFEVNKMLNFDREAAFGMRLNIASGTAVRFEPGEEKVVQLTEFGGNKEIYGLSGLTQGSVISEKVKRESLKRAKENNFKGVK